MNCTYCGAPMLDGSVLCTACGKLTPAFERTYRRPDPTVGASAPVRGDYDPEVAGAKKALADHDPKRLLRLVIAAIVAVGVLSGVLGHVLPDETVEEYRAVVEGVPTGYETLLETYFDAFSASDTAAIAALYPAALAEGDVSTRDDWSAYYGEDVRDWTVTDVRTHTGADAAGVGLLLGTEVEQYVDVEVSAELQGWRSARTFDFDLVQIDGTWYLYEIW